MTTQLACRVEGTTPKRREQWLGLLRHLPSDYADADVAPVAKLL